MSVTAGLANSGLVAACTPAAVAFSHALGDPQRAQSAVLARILAANGRTCFGQAHGFGGITGAADYSRSVPVASWDDLAPWVDRAVSGESGVLTREPIDLFEPTGGSSGATKLVPVTRSSRADVWRAVAPWLYDLYSHHPEAIGGSAYWSVSPVGEGPRATQGGVRIGFDSDEEYLGGSFAWLVRSAMAAPSALGGIGDMAAFRYTTLLYLLGRRDLALISVWNPTFLTLLLEALPEFGDALVADISDGALRPPGDLDSALHDQLLRGLRADSQRAREVASALAIADAAERHAAIWPRLSIMSCWADAHAAAPAAALARLLPQARMQPKGLLATEACFTVPMIDAPGPVPALRSHYFEFEPEAGGEPVGIGGVEHGRRYNVVVTTSGGLYRYRIGDIVEGGPFWGRCPTVLFAGRTSEVSDRFGEKLEEAHVARAIRTAFADAAAAPRFAMLAYDTGSHAYALFAELPHDVAAVSVIEGALDATLCENVHYAYCRRLGQLAPARLVTVRDGSATYLAACAARGQRAGDVKVVALHAGDGWPEVFAQGARA